MWSKDFVLKNTKNDMLDIFWVLQNSEIKIIYLFLHIKVAQINGACGLFFLVCI